MTSLSCEATSLPPRDTYKTEITTTTNNLKYAQPTNSLMKHDVKVTIILIAIFLLAQVTGLFLIKQSLHDISCKDGTCTAEYQEAITGPRPETSGVSSILYIVFGVAGGTALLLIIAKYGQTRLWKIWFFLAVLLASGVALGVVLPPWVAWLIATILAAWKFWRPNIVSYNITEILMYSGIAVLLVPILNVTWTLVLLVLISIYDFIAVWRSGHMVTMAKFITESHAFAGLVVSYDEKKKKVFTAIAPKNKGKKGAKKITAKQAILGGGDLAFPLLFAGVILQERVETFAQIGMSMTQAVKAAFPIALIISLFAGIAVSWLLLAAKKDKFYPAMPFITAGCVAGWLVTLLI